MDSSAKINPYFSSKSFKIQSLIKAGSKISLKPISIRFSMNSMKIRMAFSPNLKCLCSLKAYLKRQMHRSKRMAPK